MLQMLQKLVVFAIPASIATNNVARNAAYSTSSGHRFIT